MFGQVVFYCFSVGVGAFVLGLSIISSFFSLHLAKGNQVKKEVNVNEHVVQCVKHLRIFNLDTLRNLHFKFLHAYI